MDKKGQVAIFVIVAIVIIVILVLFFSIYRGPDVSTVEDFNPENFIDKCLRENVRNTIEVMASQGGFVNPSDFKTYNNARVAYLCKNINYYESCVMQYPRFITSLENEIEENIREQVQNCFISLESELEERNFEHSGGDLEITANLKPEIVEVVTHRDFSFSKNGVGKDFDSFRTEIKNPLYDLASLASEITSQEAKFCYFEYVGFNVLYPKFDVRKFTMSDSTKIYTIKHKKSGIEMNIAIRGCAIPAGF